MAHRPASTASLETALFRAQMQLMFWKLLAANLMTIIGIGYVLLIVLAVTDWRP